MTEIVYAIGAKHVYICTHAFQNYERNEHYDNMTM